MDYLTLALEAARAAGDILREQFRAPRDVGVKGPRDLISDADRCAEQRILAMLGRACPDIGWHAEESGIRKGRSDRMWYIDPLDGTAAFLSGTPYFSVSIALIDGGEVQAAVVYNPLLDEAYTARRGGGAFLNGSLIRVSGRTRLDESLVACAYAVDDESVGLGVGYLKRLTLRARKVLVHFSPALDMCNVARGRLDGYVDNGTMPEDHAAAGLIVSEAGGVVHTFGKRSWDPRAVGLVASNGPLQAELHALASA